MGRPQFSYPEKSLNSLYQVSQAVMIHKVAHSDRMRIFPNLESLKVVQNRPPPLARAIAILSVSINTRLFLLLFKC